MSINLNSFLPLDVSMTYASDESKIFNLKICLRSRERAKLINGKCTQKRIVKYLKAANNELDMIKKEIKAGRDKFLFIESIVSDVGSIYLSGLIPNNLYNLLLNNCNEMWKLNIDVIDRLTKYCPTPLVTFGDTRDELLSDEEDDEDLN